MIQTGNRLARWRGIGCGKAYLEPCLATQLNHPPPKTMARVRGQGQGGIKGSSKGLDPSLHSEIIKPIQMSRDIYNKLKKYNKSLPQARWHWASR